MVARGHRDVIEDAEAHRPRAAGVVAGRADGAKRAEFLLENQVDRQDRRAGGAQRRMRVRVHRRVRIEVHGAAVRRDLADRFT